MAMALTSIAVHYLCSPYSLARPNNNNSSNSNNGKTRKQTTFPKKQPSKNPNTQFKSPRLPPPPSISLSSSAVYGGDATTYTRLPPKDDYVLSPFHSPYESSAEVKLSDSKIIHQKPSITKIETDSDEISSEDKVFKGKSSFDYEEFELYEVNTDYESEDDVDDYDEDKDEDDVFGFKIGGNGVAFDGEEEEKENEKEKGVPAVMRCFDKAKIYVKAGDGGNGVVAFRREKYVPLGGPSGGDGGRGGNVYVEVDDSMNSLLPFRQCVHFRAGRGAHGQGRKQNGAKGEDVVVKVPPGTVVREAGEDGVEGDVLLELLHPGQRALLLPGGRGGRGNASFKSGMNKVPKIAENGEEGLEM